MAMPRPCAEMADTRTSVLPSLVVNVECGAGVFRAIRAVLCLRHFSGILAIIATLECTGQALPQLVGYPHPCVDIGKERCSTDCRKVL